MYLITDDYDMYTAGTVAYDNKNSGLVAKDVQGAIDEVNTNRVGFISGTLLHTISTANTSYTATKNCWARCTIKGKYNVSNNGISIDGINLMHIYKYDESKTTSDEILELSNILPVKKGQVIKTGTDGSYAVKIYEMI